MLIRPFLQIFQQDSLMAVHVDGPVALNSGARQRLQ
jgi:hypothetical protein